MMMERWLESAHALCFKNTQSECVQEGRWCHDPRLKQKGKKKKDILSFRAKAENNPVGFRECAHNMYAQHRNSTLQLMDTGHISFIELFFKKLKIITFIGQDCEPQPNPI